MKKGLSYWLIFVLPAAMYACGDEVSDSTDDDGGSSGAGNPAALEAACLRYCEASIGANCGGQQLTEAQCKAGCPLMFEQLDGQCVAEYTATFHCAADGGFECYEDTPVPSSTCVSESVALSECMEDGDCKQFCAQAVPAGCGGATEDACLTDCKEQLADQEEAFCDYAYEDVLRCWGSAGVECVEGRPSANGCEEEIIETGDCLTFDDTCSGLCWVAEQMGCGDGCEAECEAKNDHAQCAFEFDVLVGCQLRSDNASCQDGSLVFDDDCSYEKEQLDACLAGG
jgi:hypothetical protein